MLPVWKSIFAWYQLRHLVLRKGMCFPVYFVYAMMELFTFQATHRAPASPPCVCGFKND